MSAWLGVAACRMALDDLDAAGQALTEAVQLDPEHPGVWGRIALVASKGGRAEEAAAALKVWGAGGQMCGGRCVGNPCSRWLHCPKGGAVCSQEFGTRAVELQYNPSLSLQLQLFSPSGAAGPYVRPSSIESLSLPIACSSCFSSVPPP